MDKHRLQLLIASIFICSFICTFSSSAQLPEQPNEPISLPGKPIPPDYSKLSEHNIQWLKTQSAQGQMEFLLGAAINHDQGATEMISKLLESWRGKLHRSQRWQDLETTALYSNDLRVRAAAVEINLVVNNLAKTEDTAKQLIESGKQEESNRPWDAWELGMLASRGIHVDEIHELLNTWVHDKNEQTRFWAVEGLATLEPTRPSKIFWMCSAMTLRWKFVNAQGAALRSQECSPANNVCKPYRDCSNLPMILLLMQRHARGFIRHCVKSRIKTCLTILQLGATGIAVKAQKKRETSGKRSHGQCWGTANGNVRQSSGGWSLCG